MEDAESLLCCTYLNKDCSFQFAVGPGPKIPSSQWAPAVTIDSESLVDMMGRTSCAVANRGFPISMNPERSRKIGAVKILARRSGHLHSGV